MKNITLIFCLGLLLMPPKWALGQSHKLHITAITSGGGASSSTSYRLNTTVGEVSVDTSYSTTYSFEQGFWYQHNAVQNIYSNAYLVNDGWNLISIGKEVQDYTREVLFPTAQSSAYYYSDGYKRQDTLIPGRGYWLKFTGAQPILYTGVPETSDTIEIVNKWNLIGGLGCSVSTASIVALGTVISSPFYAFDGSYFAATTLEPGKAYWVKCTGSGALVLNCPGD